VSNAVPSITKEFNSVDAAGWYGSSKSAEATMTNPNVALLTLVSCSRLSSYHFGIPTILRSYLLQLLDQIHLDYRHIHL
jgi:hypothetical protein